MACPTLPEITVTADALGRIKFNQYLNDYDVSDELALLDVWIKKKDDTPVASENARPAWLAYAFSQEQYTGEYTNDQGNPETGTIKRGTVAFNLDGNDPGLDAGSVYLIGVRGTDQVNDPVEGEFCLTVQGFGTAVALLHWEDDIRGGQLGGSLGTLVVDNEKTQAGVRAMTWDPLREEVIYHASDGDEIIYASPIDGTSSFEALFTPNDQASVRGMCVVGRTLLVATRYDVEEYDLESRSFLGRYSFPGAFTTPGGLVATPDETIYLTDGSDLYTYALGGTFTQLSTLTDGVRYLSYDNDTLYAVNIITDRLTAITPGTGAQADTAVVTDGNEPTLVAQDLAYVAEDQDIDIYNLDGTLHLETAYNGGMGGTVLSMTPTSVAP